MKKLLFGILRYLIGNLSKIISKIRSPWIRKQITYKDVLTMKRCLQIGDVVLTRTNGELSTIIIPGFWKHVAIYVGNGQIIDATSNGVYIRYLADLSMAADNVAILRMKNVTQHIQDQLYCFAHSQVGKPYDFKMDSGNTDAFYCSELIYHSYNHIMPNFLDLRNRGGILTVTPEDLYKAHSKFILLWEKVTK